ncbi:hypothetical protein [Methylobacterium nonmethylotrophicum]|uniref:Uncharacterized protein n=1 Tax=Methylobacterium nonmethylotrophicum TaxID=1141884 RepID=A0A4Z0NMV1_9HYPH|nr:hypothetical protein [Methylobacterium nonmethylotrophicum]TGD97199.1 hypothetical protein EU555_20790 [Methylobacterium nonmethylotrophicum]
MGSPIGSTYTNPVTVNGYACWNCTDVEKAKQFVNPAARSDGVGTADRTAAQGADQGPDGTGTRPALSAADRAAGLGRLVDRLV